MDADARQTVVPILFANHCENLFFFSWTSKKDLKLEYHLPNFKQTLIIDSVRSLWWNESLPNLDFIWSNEEIDLIDYSL